MFTSNSAFSDAISSITFTCFTRSVVTNLIFPGYTSGSFSIGVVNIAVISFVWLGLNKKAYSFRSMNSFRLVISMTPSIG